jgi:ankyrin repeat protein
VNVQNKEGDTPLHLAAGGNTTNSTANSSRKGTSFVKRLLLQHANPNIQNNVIKKYLMFLPHWLCCPLPPYPFCYIINDVNALYKQTRISTFTINFCI